VATLVQVKRKTSSTVRGFFSYNGSPQDLDDGVPAVTVTNPDGTTHSTPAATHVEPAAGNPGAYQFVLAAQPEVTILGVAWVGTIGGQQQTLEGRVEVVGELLFNHGDLRRLTVNDTARFADTGKFPDAKLQGARTATLEEFTKILGFSPVPRFAREVLSGNGRSSLFVRSHKCSALLAVTIDGTAQTVADFDLEETGELVWAAGSFPATRRRNVAVSYAHGWGAPQGACSDRALAAAATELQPGLAASTSTVTTPSGETYVFDPAGQVTRAGTTRYYGSPRIDSWLNLHRSASLAVA
jgi:hypothetical protein